MFDGCVLYTLSPAADIKWVVLHRSSSDPQSLLSSRVLYNLSPAADTKWVVLHRSSSDPQSLLHVQSGVGLSCLVTQLVEEWACLQNVFGLLVSLAAVAETELTLPPLSSVKLPDGDVVTQWVERRPRDPMDSMTRGSNPVRSTRKVCKSFSESKCCASSLSVCPTPRVYTHA